MAVLAQGVTEASFVAARAWRVRHGCRAVSARINGCTRVGGWGGGSEKRRYSHFAAVNDTGVTGNGQWRGGLWTQPQIHSFRRSMATHTSPYEAVVVGAGPAGITCVGNLLARNLSPILWVDDGFDGGRINRMYREVPSNTKVRLFMDFANGVPPFQNIASGEHAADTNGKEDRLKFMKDLDQNQGCRLSNAADMALILTDGLKRTPGVEAEQGRVSSATLNDNDSSEARWTVNLDNTNLVSTSNQTSTAQTKRLVFCTGASPNNSPLPVHIPHIRNLDLDIALSPSRLRAALAREGPVTISVIGASHSAIIVLMNLYNLAASSRPDLRIRWFTRHPLRYAKEMDGWILLDNTGLKGDAATWAHDNLEPENFEKSDVSKYMERIAYEAGDEEGTFEERMPGSQFYVQAIGYSRDPLPMLTTSNGTPIQPKFDHQKGSFEYSQNGNEKEGMAKLPGLYGAGIAFPERVVDPHGNVEMAVGFGKFMRFVKRVVNEWN